MSEFVKTLTFVAVAAVLTGLAGLTHWMNQPKTRDEFKLVGKPFYEDFTSSSQAKSLEVAAINPESLELQTFSVKNIDGIWRIPSHHDYPAEAAVRLAETATSVIGLEREALVGRLASEQEKLGVVDPLNNEAVAEDPESAGQRITLKDAEGQPVVDLIIGKEAGEVKVDEAELGMHEGMVPDKYYYVRRADEQQTYKVRLNIDLSTRFSDWIDPDLLRLETEKVVQLEIDHYTPIEKRVHPLSPVTEMVKDQGDQIELTRESSTDPWTLEDMQKEMEELDTARVNQIVTVLDQLEITGVRPKFKYEGHLLLTPELTSNAQPEWRNNPQSWQRAFNECQAELDSHGFSLAGTTEQLELLSENGELKVGTNQGVRYVLHIGSEADGEVQEIEVGGAKSNGDETSAEVDEPANGQVGDTETKASESDTVADEQAKNRYMIVRVVFDETLLGGKPEKPLEPTAPEKPERYEPAKVENDDSDAEATDTENPERDPTFVKYDAELAEYEQARIDYELALTQYEQALKSYEKKVTAGEQIVTDLNERFGDWYYVVSAENLKTLQSERDDIVETKEPPHDQASAERRTPADRETQTPIPPKPDISFPEIELDEEPGDEPSESSEEPLEESGTTPADNGDDEPQP